MATVQTIHVIDIVATTRQLALVNKLLGGDADLHAVVAEGLTRQMGLGPLAYPIYVN